MCTFSGGFHRRTVLKQLAVCSQLPTMRTFRNLQAQRIALMLRCVHITDVADATQSCDRLWALALLAGCTVIVLAI